MSTNSAENQVTKKPAFTSEKLLKNPYVLTVITVLLIATLLLTVKASNEQSSVITKAQEATATVLYVNPDGLDTNSGESLSSPLKTIQAALNKAAPGTTINLAAGTYRETLTTKIDGTVIAPITIKGPETGKNPAGRYQAVLYGGSGRIVNVNHSYYVFQGFTIDGQEALASTTYPTTLAAVRSFKDSNQGQTRNNKLIYIGSGDTTHDLTGIVIDDMYLNGAGGECVRLRNKATGNEIKNSVIQWCGMYPSGDDSSKYKYHNGEGIYIGTSPKSTDQPMYANDSGAFNNIHDNTIYTFGAECFEVKENAHDNSFQNNDCRYNDETYAFLGSNIELRGYNNKIIGNIIKGSRAVGLKMKSDSTSYTQGGNTGQNNAFSEISNESIRNDQNTSQGLFCGNTFTGTVLVGTSVGNPTAPCPGPTDTPAPGLPTSTPTPTVEGLTPSPTITAGGTSMTFTKQVALASDDAEEQINNNKVNLGSDLQLINDSGKLQQVGLRFQGVTIPKGAKIINAYIEFTAKTGSSDATSLVLFGESIANSTTFVSTNKNITNRVKTTASVNWNAIPAWVNNGRYQTPNLSPVVQQIINNSGWTSGNAMTFIVTGSGKRVANSYNNSAAKAPKLVIIYTN